MKLIWLQNLALEKVRVAKLSAILLLILGKVEDNLQSPGVGP